MTTLIIKVEGAFCDAKNTRLNYNIERISYKNMCFNGADLTCANFNQANLEGCSFINAGLIEAYFGNSNLKGANLKNATATKACFTGSDVTESNLESAHLAHAILRHTNLTAANLDTCYLKKADLTRVVLQNANLTSVDFTQADLTYADLSDSNLTDADLSGAILSDVNLRGAIGLGTREDEIAFARDLLRKLAIGEGKLSMRHWHSPNCGTTHCLAGWAFPKEEYPGQKASLKYPTLAQFFFSTRDEAMNALKLVAAGELSVFPE
jgi:uncharacterized protein YjbI with pentapeptide repeats